MPHRVRVAPPRAPATLRGYGLPGHAGGARAPLAAALMLAFGGAPLALPMPAFAATITVASPGDTGVANPGTCTLRQAIVSMNTGTTADGGCVASGTFGQGDTIQFAGSLFSGGNATITLDETYHRNFVGYGGLHVTPGNLVIDAGTGRNVTVERSLAATRDFSVFKVKGGALTLTGFTIQNGIGDTNAAKYMGGDGGGMVAQNASVTLDRCVVRNNRTGNEDLGWGGGLFVQGKLTLRSSRVSDNHAGLGGGLAAAVAISIVDSTLSGNTAPYGGAVGGLADISITNSTVSGNAASDAGAAIFLGADDKSLSLLNDTFACNRIADGAAIALTSASVRFDAIGTIFADTTNALCTTQTLLEAASVGGTFVVSGDHNLLASASAIGGGTSFPSGTLFGDPLLQALAGNGGPTSTHALGAGSPALNAGSNPASLSHDQRGADYARWVGRNPDIGAFEDQTSNLCGAANGHPFASLDAGAPTLCGASAVLQGFFGSGPWSWFCAASADPSNNEFCGASVLANVSLAIANANDQTISSATYGQPLHLRAKVADGRSPPSATPIGTVSFFDATGGGFVPICVQVMLTAGLAVCDTTNAPIDAGARQLKALYNGNGTFGMTSGSAIGVQVNPATSTTAITAQTPDPVTLGAAFTVVAQVTANVPSVATPTGVVGIDDATDGTSCSYDLAAPSPGCALTPHGAGAHSLTIRYLGNANVGTSSVAAQEDVARAASTTNLLLSSATIALGDSLTATVDVASDVPSAFTVPSGLVIVGDDGCTVALPATACTWTPHGAGIRNLRADYSGDGNFMPAQSAPMSVEVARGTTAITLALSSSAIMLGEPVVATAGISTNVPTGVAAPTGPLLVGDGLGDSCTIVPPGTSCEFTPGSAGAQTITATYAGDANFAGSSASAALDVANLPAQLTLAIDDGRSHVRYGAMLTYTITLDNSGQDAASDVAVSGLPSTNFAGAALTWNCVPANGAICTSSGSGAALTDTVTLPANSALTWTVKATVPPDADAGEIAFAVNAGDASASDSDVLVTFRDGFE